MPENKPLQPIKFSKAEKNLMRCQTCGKPYVEVKDGIVKKKTGHIFRGDCEHIPRGARLSVG